MKAAQFNKYGGPEVIEINNEAKKPELKEGQVLVEVYAAGLNPVESAIRSGYMKDMLPLEFPVNAGGDFSGVISESNGVGDFKTGDEVYGIGNHFKGATGSLAEYIAVNNINVALKPKSITFEQAAALPLVGVSTIQGLEEEMKLQKGQKVLIHGGAGGIGSLAIQLAKHIGAFVATTVATEDVELAKQLGADQVIDFMTEKFEDIIHDFDGVFVTNAKVLNDSLNVLKSGGILVSMVGAPDEGKAREKGITAIAQMTKSTREQLNRLTELVDQGVIKPEVAKVFPLEQTEDAFRMFEEEHPRGKIIVKIK